LLSTFHAFHFLLSAGEMDVGYWRPQILENRDKHQIIELSWLERSWGAEERAQEQSCVAATAQILFIWALPCLGPCPTSATGVQGLMRTWATSFEVLSY
jgi:hypothetical protein